MKVLKTSYPKKITKAMLHDLLSNMSDKEESSNENRERNDSLEEESKATLLVNSTIYKNVSPADIRKLISVPKKKKSPDKIKKEKKILENKTKLLQVKDT